MIATIAVILWVVFGTIAIAMVLNRWLTPAVDHHEPFSPDGALRLHEKLRALSTDSAQVLLAVQKAERNITAFVVNLRDPSTTVVFEAPGTDRVMVSLLHVPEVGDALSVWQTTPLYTVAERRWVISRFGDRSCVVRLEVAQAMPARVWRGGEEDTDLVSVLQWHRVEDAAPDDGQTVAAAYQIKATDYYGGEPDAQLPDVMQVLLWDKATYSAELNKYLCDSSKPHEEVWFKSVVAWAEIRLPQEWRTK